jgi:hypothetical protein
MMRSKKNAIFNRTVAYDEDSDPEQIAIELKNDNRRDQVLDDR